MKKYFYNLERKVKVSGLSSEERLGKPASCSISQLAVTSVIGKAWPSQMQSVKKQSLPIKLVPLLHSKLTTTNMLLQVHLFWHINLLSKRLVFFQKISCQEAQVLQCLTSVALEECRMVDEKSYRKRNKQKQRREKEIKIFLLLFLKLEVNITVMVLVTQWKQFEEVTEV